MTQFMFHGPQFYTGVLFRLHNPSKEIEVLTSIGSARSPGRAQESACCRSHRRGCYHHRR